MEQFKDSILKLVIETSSNLPPDVRRAIGRAMEIETPGTQAALALQAIAENVDMACDTAAPICQDTGMPTFEIKTPIGTNQIVMKQQIKDAIAEATRLGKLRPNSVDILTNKNTGNNLGEGTPVMHFDQNQEPVCEQFAYAQDIFNYFCSLNTADYCRSNADHGNLARQDPLI